MREHTPGVPVRPERASVAACLGLLALLCWPQPAYPLSAPPRQQSAAATPGKAVEEAIRDVLRAYEAALEGLDADAVKKVQPSIDLEGLKRAFREMRSLEVDIDDIRVLSADQSSARVSCRVAQTLTPRVGSRQTTRVTRVLRLRLEDGAWVIQAFER
jgi:hypothetical protein